MNTVYLIVRFTVDTGIPVYRDVLTAGEYPVEQIGPILQVLLHQENGRDYTEAKNKMMAWSKAHVGNMDGKGWCFAELMKSEAARGKYMGGR